MVELLIRKGASVNLQLQTGEYGSVLAAAAYEGYNTIIETPLDAGAKASLALDYGTYSTVINAAQAGEKMTGIACYELERDQLTDPYAGLRDMLRLQDEDSIKSRWAAVLNMLECAIKREHWRHSNDEIEGTELEFLVNFFSDIF